MIFKMYSLICDFQNQPDIVDKYYSRLVLKAQNMRLNVLFQKTFQVHYVYILLFDKLRIAPAIFLFVDQAGAIQYFALRFLLFFLFS